MRRYHRSAAPTSSHPIRDRMEFVQRLPFTELIASSTQQHGLERDKGPTERGGLRYGYRYITYPYLR
ncbi:hypothetical protein LY76DRAFT_596465 [Colletotrichum caudatum]|nr:hypothetical protein LY76DRAFT_596465 [Colletotrichum caudatum]